MVPRSCAKVRGVFVQQPELGLGHLGEARPVNRTGTVGNATRYRGAHFGRWLKDDLQDISSIPSECSYP